MAKETKSGVLIIRPDFKGYQQMLNGLHNFLTGFVLDAAVPHWNNAVRVFFIGSGNNPTPSISGKDVMNLVPIIQRILHANDGKNFPVGSKQLSHSSLLFRQLLLVGYSLILAAAAFLMDAANIVFCGEHLFYCFRDRFYCGFIFPFIAPLRMPCSIYRTFCILLYCTFTRSHIYFFHSIPNFRNVTIHGIRTLLPESPNASW